MQKTISFMEKAMTKLVSYKFVDSEGNLRDKVIAASSKLKWEPTWFDGSSFGFRKTSNSDLLLVPDPETRHVDPIRNMESMFCFLYTPDENPLEADFRRFAAAIMDVDEQTRGALFGVEPEFFLLSDTGSDSLRSLRYVPYGEADSWSAQDVDRQYKWYGSLPPTDETQYIRDEMVKNLSTAGIEVESCHHEVAPGQAEISWRCDNLLRTCDKMLLAKYIIQATAAMFKDKQGRAVSATFDPKPFEGINGSGCHVHQSVPAMRGNEEVLLAYIQGLVDNYDDLTKVCNVHENSHKRLVPGFEAPTKENNGYGFCDRTKTIRIPAAGGRLEYRLPDPAMNPYVALPLMLRLGREMVRTKCNV
jgi:glutamine synthetase